MILGTFSKLYGLAGLRIGYGFAHQKTIAFLNKVRSPFNTTSPAQVAAIAALEDREFAEAYLDLNHRETEYVCSELEAMGLRVTPTVCNFVLVDTPLPSKEFFDKLLREGVIVRPMAGWGFPESVRVSFHVREGNDRFLEATRKVLKR
jgi:histidinol-phosphate aminotransferase